MRTGEKETAPGSRSRGRRWLIALAPILAALALWQLWRADPLVNSDAPPLAGSLVSSERFDLDTLGGKPVLVHFWATWCPVCQLGADTIDAIAQDFDVVTVAIQSGETAALAEHMRREGLSFPVIADPAGTLAASWGVRGVPASFVLDSSGRIRFATAGYSTEIGLRGRLWLADKID